MDHGAGIIVHIHHIVSARDLHSGRQIGNTVTAHNLQNGFPPSHQGDLHTVGFHCLNGTQYGSLRRVIAAHGIKNDLHCVSLLSGWILWKHPPGVHFDLCLSFFHNPANWNL